MQRADECDCRFATIAPMPAKYQRWTWPAALVLLTGTGMTARADDVFDFARAPAMSIVTLSPEGQWISYVRQEGANQQLVLRLLSNDAEQATLQVESKHERIRWCDWSGADRLLCGTVRPVRRPDRVSEATRLYAIEARSGKVRELNLRLPDAVRDNVIDLWPSGPDRVLLQHDPTGSGHPEVSELDVRNGELRRVVRAQPPISRWMSDGEGTVRLGIATTPLTATLFTRSREGSPWEVKLQQSLSDSQAIAPLAFAGMGSLFVLGHHQGRAALFSWSLAGNEPPTLLLADPVFDIDGPLLLDPRTRQLISIRFAGEDERQHFFDPVVQEQHRWVDGQLPDTFNALVAMSRDGKLRLIRAASDLDPPSFYVHDTRTQALKPVGHEYPELEGRDLLPMSVTSYRARDGQIIPAYLTMPRGTEEPVPAVVLPHGGPETRVVKGFDPLVQFLAANGFAVLQMNFRGSFGYGAAFAAAGAGQWGGVIQDDITDGAKWLVSEGVADPARLCIAGESFGGYAAMLGAVREPRLYACAASFAGVSDLMAFRQYTQRLQSAVTWDARLGDDQQALWRMSPLAEVASLSAPVFLMHGRLDPVVPVAQTRRFARELRVAGKPHRFLERVECDHEMTIEACRVEFFSEIRQFLAEGTSKGSRAPTPP